ncbi:hypothetical protein FBT96_19405 [Rhodobacter capsulatus]|uniref:Uncharacterized protein n=1 Tax=Rhodobacter capsulatus TaxID=1061 RepID=A0A4U1JKZ0_RHOCA|nr:hypothetical protein [Rhodobacter capsulatus]TKD13570.1 hypothetical protein FBT96_19405 [Rhodobacter capsulatus]
MSDEKKSAPPSLPHQAIDIGLPVEWMLDPHDQKVVLGVVYEFSQSKVRKIVWYTANKRRAKSFKVVRELGFSDGAQEISPETP